MNEELIKFYRRMSITPPTSEALSKRTITLNRLIEGQFKNIFEYLRHYFAKPLLSPDSLNLLKEELLVDDPYFDPENSFELKVLSGAMVYFYIRAKKDNWIDVALAVISGKFEIDASLLPFADLIQIAQTELTKEAISIRTNSIDHLDGFLANLKDLSDISPDGISKVVVSENKELYRVIKELSKQVFVLREESDVHWWLFRSYSKTFSGAFADLQIEKLPFALAFELSTLMKLRPYPPNSDQFLKYALGSRHGSFQLKQYINAIPTELKEELLLTKVSSTENLTPMHLAIHKSLETLGSDSWVAAFEHRAAVKADIELTLLEATNQIYSERLLLK